PRLLAELRGTDYVTGSRFVRGGRCDYGGYRWLVSRPANWGGRALLGTRLPEATTALRAHPTALLKRPPLPPLRSDGYSFFVETSYWISSGPNRCAEIPIHFRNRAAGASKLPRLQILFGIFLLLRLFFFRLLRRTATGSGPTGSDAKCYFCQSTY